MATYPVGLPVGTVTVSIYELLADTLSDGDDLPDAGDVTLTVEFLPTVKAIRFGGKIYRLRGLTWTGTSVLTAPDGTGGFVLPSTAGTGLALGDLLPGYCRAVWIRRTATNSAPIDADGFTLAVTGDTAA